MVLSSSHCGIHAATCYGSLRRVRHSTGSQVQRVKHRRLAITAASATLAACLLLEASTPLWLTPGLPDLFRHGFQQKLEAKLSVQPPSVPEVQDHSWVPQTVLAAAAAALVSCVLLGTTARAAENMAAVAPCLLQKCEVPLAKCLLSPTCAADLTCILGCQGQKDVGGCEVRCGDFFENKEVQEFNRCALKPENKGCVPQRQDDGTYPVPPVEAVTKEFDVTSFDGGWYISAGLNPLFDTFPGQIHFCVGEPPKPAEGSNGRLFAKLNWRVPEPDGEFFKRETVQNFKVDAKRPGVLYNHDNDYLHYQDDWYILDHADEKDKDKGFVLVYYRGRNDAWDGYGGAVLYTRSRTVPESIVPRVQKSCKLAGLDFNKFIRTDNTCNEIVDAGRLQRRFVTRNVEAAELSVAEQLTQARRFVTDSVQNQRGSVLQEISKDTRVAQKRLESMSKDFVVELDKEEQNLLRWLTGLLRA